MKLVLQILAAIAAVTSVHTQSRRTDAMQDARVAALDAIAQWRHRSPHVAQALGVNRMTVRKWLGSYNMTPIGMPRGRGKARRGRQGAARPGRRHGVAGLGGAWRAGRLGRAGKVWQG